jgi:hypothetical protein
MSVQMGWYDDSRTILQIEIRGAWKWEEIMHALQDVWQSANSVGHPVALLYLLDHVAWRSYPLQDLVTHLRMVYQLQPRHISPVVAVAQGQIQFVQMLYQSLRPAVPQLRDTYIVSDINAALDVIGRHHKLFTRPAKRIGIDTGVLHSKKNGDANRRAKI